MKSLYGYITESRPDLYHFTNGANLVRMLKYDKYEASVNDGRNPRGYNFYMSTTRQPFSKIGYPSGMIDADICKIVLDGVALSSRYKIIPVDWGRTKSIALRDRWPGGPEDWDKNKAEILKQTNVESEDRILLKSDSIPQFHKYIKKIYIDTNTIGPRDAEEIIRLADKHSIEVEVLATADEFARAH